MATSTSTVTPAQAATSTSRKPRKSTINLATAKVADGALEAPRSIYEIVGYTTNPYKTKDLETYRKTLASMQLWELQDHAQKLAVMPSFNRGVIIKRLEDKFLQETRKFARTQQSASQPNSDSPYRAQAEAILRR